MSDEFLNMLFDIPMILVFLGQNLSLIIEFGVLKCFLRFSAH